MMRKDNRPYWLKQSMDRFNQQYVDWYVAPQLDRVGEDFQVAGSRHLQISGAGVRVEDHVHVMALKDSPVRLSSFDGQGNIDIGSFCVINPGVRMTSAEHIQIGESCLFAMHCYLSDADWHDTHARIFAPGKTSKIVLEDNVWIGDSAFIGKGVTLGENSIVGAYSVVTKDVPANTIVGGNPAREIGRVNPDEVVTRRAMFEGDVSYNEFAADGFKRASASNTLLGFLGSLIKPGPAD